MRFLEFQKFCNKNNLKIFSINDLKILFSGYSIEYLRLKINRWIKRGYLKKLKKGLYVFSDENIDEFEIASKLVCPSYISLESALSHYSIIPDISSQVTSISTKNTNSFEINKIIYNYCHIKNELFFDFIELRDGIFIASPEKTILDFLYFRNPTENDQFFERLNQEILKKLNMKHLKKLSEKFPPKIQKLINVFISNF
jgi:predicted transcriptional regulator of viral defense system